MLWICVLYAGFASVFTLGKTILSTSEPIFCIGSRMTLAGALILLYLLWYRPQSLKMNGRQWLCLGTLALSNIYITNALEFWALQHLTSIKTCFFYSLSPFIAALLSLLLFSERLSQRQMWGLCIGFFGFLPFLLSQENGEPFSMDIFWMGWPEAAMLTAVFANAYGWILLKQAIQEHNIAPFVANGASMFLGGLMALAHSLFSESWDPIPVSDMTTFTILSLSIMIISNFFCFNLYGYLLKRYSATFLSFAGFMTPLFTALYGYLFLGETTGLVFYISIATVLLGLAMFYQEELRRGITASPPPPITVAY